MLCSRCKINKPENCFTKNKTRKRGYNGNCKVCDAEYRNKNKSKLSKYNLQYKQRNKSLLKEKAKVYINKNLKKLSESKKNYKLLSRYKINMSEYEKLVLKQNKKCLICEKEKKLVVDHNHTTGAVRGLLCAKCNFGLGHFSDNITFLKNSINYLKKYDRKKRINFSPSI